MSMSSWLLRQRLRVRFALVLLVLLGAGDVSLHADATGAVSNVVYAVQHSTFDGGGGRAGSLDYTVDVTLGGLGGIIEAVGNTASARQGYSGQLNDPPIARTDTITLTPGQPTEIDITDLLANDTDLERDPLALLDVTSPTAQGGTATLRDGGIYYIPPAQVVDDDAFYYRVRDSLGNLSVGKVNLMKSLLVVADAVSRSYGAANPVFTGTVYGLLPSDNITVTYNSAGTRDSAVGSYEITPSFADPDHQLDKYHVIIVKGTLTITPAALTVTAFDASRFYGAGNPVLDGRITGLQTNDPITAVYETPATLTSPLGSYPIVPTLRDPDNRLPNYSVTYRNGVLTIVNSPPVLTAIGNKSVNEGTLLTFTATATDPDLPAQTLTFSLDPGAPAGASITVGGVFTWTPTEAQGPSVNDVTIRVSDGVASVSETIQIVVNEVNRPPVLAAMGNKSVNEGTLLNFTATATDPDLPAQTLTFSLDPGAPAGASITVGGVFIWTPTEAQGPSVNDVTIRVSDGVASVSETIQIVVNEVNRPPVLAAIGNKSANEGTLLTFTATATDPDVPAQTLTFSLNPGAPAGASITAGGVFSWTPTEVQGPSVNDVTIRVSDGVASVSETIQIVVNEVNRPPVLAAMGNKSVNEGTLLTFTSTATDPDLPAQTLTFSLDPGAPAGASITPGGVFSWTPTEAQGPSVNAVTIRVSDGVASVSETIQIVVNQVNRPPVLAAIGDKTVNEESLLTFTAKATDPDTPAQTLTFSLDPDAPAGARITVAGVFSWTPTEAQGPSVNAVTIRVSDGVASVSETIQIVVNQVNRPPVLAAIGDKTVDEWRLLTFRATATDPDLPAQQLTFSLDEDAPGGTSITASGVFTWTPTESQAPSVNPVTIRVSDGIASVSETIQILVNEINQPPVLAAIGNKSVNEGSLLTFTATATDLDMPTQLLTFSLDPGAPAGASITLGGVFTWTPTEAEGGSEYNVTIRVSDGVASASEKIKITVNKANRPPVLAHIGNQSVDEETPLTFTASATDSDLPAQTLTFSLDEGAPHNASITPAGAFTWTPTEAEGGSEYNVTIRVSDGVASASEKIKITVNKANRPPVLAHIGNQSVDEETPLTFTASATDSDLPAQTLTFSLDEGAPHNASITPAGAFTWTPTEAEGGSEYNVTIRVSDGVASASEKIKITVNKANRPPVLAHIGNQSVDEETPLTFTASATDSDQPAQTLTFSLEGAPHNASITPAGAFTWTPTEAEGGSEYNVTIRVSDGLASASEPIKITVNKVNRPPVLAHIGNQSVDEETPLTFTASATDSDLPAKTLTFSLDEGAPHNASITPAGAFTWTPTEAEDGSEYNVTIRVSDGLASASEPIKITVNEVNRPPVLAHIGNQSVDEETPLTFTASATDSDLPAQTLTFSLDEGAPHNASITPAGAFTWTPTEAEGGSEYNVTIRVSDGLASASEPIKITVNEVNRPPVLAHIGNQSVEGDAIDLHGQRDGFGSAGANADLQPGRGRAP